MIGSFWNLCRACPSMPVDKQLHSEYRSTYRWHEFTGSSRPEVVRRAPAPNPSQFVGATNEPPLPRRKKCPELAYKSHEFIIGSEYTDSRNNVQANRMARSEERGTPSRRSKSEGPPAVPNGRAYAIPKEDIGMSNKQAGESNGLFKKTITKLSTEYRLQFVWPNVRRIKGQVPNNRETYDEHPRKSISLGAIKASQQLRQHHQTMAALPTVHKKRSTCLKEATLHELEPLVSDAEDKKPNEKQVIFAEKKAPRIFSQTFDQERINHFITRKENFGFDTVDNKQRDAEVIMNGTAPPHSHPNLDLWFKEVIELRKKAGEYKSRGWGVEIDPELYKKQRDLWEQVSKRSSLSALSLDSSVHRPITKEEKEQENNKKSVPLAKTPHKPRVPGQAFMIDNKDEIIALPARFSHIRHHLERTTGPDVEDGALLPSPTREKLMPAITKRESESQRGSPKKTAVSRHGSPQKGSPQKSSPKKVIKMRSQSVGPEKESPKRRLRSASTAPTTKSGKKTTSTGQVLSSTTVTTTERKPRPSTLSTTFHSRMKSSSLPPSNDRANSVPATTNQQQSKHHQNQSQIASSNQMKSNEFGKIKSPQSLQMRKKDKDRTNLSSISASANVNGGMGVGISISGPKKSRSKMVIPIGNAAKPTTKSPTKTTTANTKNNQLLTNGSAGAGDGIDVDLIITQSHLAVPNQDRNLNESEADEGRGTAISVSSASPQPAAEVPEEPLIKSPPEPTRVKSPEQIIMRSPDPVNWTVPLDTGKTFTVTQNVKDGEAYSRPHSEIKASTPIEKPPPPPQSAPPQLTEQLKMDAWKHANLDTKSPFSSSSPIGKLITAQPTGAGGIPARYEAKPVPGSTLRCLDDPIFDVDPGSGFNSAAGTGTGANTSSSSTSTTTNTASTARTTANDVLEKARDRFDRFWGGNKEEKV